MKSNKVVNSNVLAIGKYINQATFSSLISILKHKNFKNMQFIIINIAFMFNISSC